jgi:hypothetical protein
MFLFISACEEKKDKPLVPDRDVAESLAGALAVNPGGLMDQIIDLCEFLIPERNAMPGPDGSRYVTMNKTYNESTQLWTITFEKVRGEEGIPGYAHIRRTYLLQYRDVADNPQKFYVTETDTARTVVFRAIHGEGNFQTRRINSELDSLSCNWLVTNANEEYVSITGEFYRAAEDTISGWNKLRLSENAILLSLNDFQVLRSVSANAYQYSSGAISGSLSAEITFLEGSPYSETSLSRVFQVDIINGRGEINLGNYNFTADLAAGELID